MIQLSGGCQILLQPVPSSFFDPGAFSAGQIYRSSVTGSTRNPFGSGNLFGVPADDSTTSHSRFAYHIAYKIEIHRIAGIWQFRPLRFKQFQSSARIHDEVHFAGSGAPEEEAARPPSAAFAVSKLGENERLPDRSYRW